MTGDELDSSVEEKKDEFIIQQSKNAASLVKLAETIGLHDVTQWVTIENMQHYLDNDLWVGYLAIPKKSSKPCGIIIAGFEEEERLWIELLVVAKEYRRQSVARFLLNELEKVGKEHGSRALFVDLDDDNKTALHFYLGVGFRNAGIIREYYYDGTNAIILLKSLEKKNDIMSD